MIIKERGVPLSIRTLEALGRRISPNHPSFQLIKSDLTKRKAGLRGEQSLDYYLNEPALDHYSIFHDIRLSVHGHPFQIDTLMLTNQFVLILEVKNISGTLHFDQKFNQLIRTTSDGREEGFPDPFSQVSQLAKTTSRLASHRKIPPHPHRNSNHHRHPCYNYQIEFRVPHSQALSR